MSHPHTRGPSARTSVFPDSPLEDHFLIHLREHAQGLNQIVSVLTVSILALRAQDAESDHDIATVIDRHASVPLDLLADELEFLLESIAAQRAVQQRAAA